MIKKILISIILLVELLAFRLWFACEKLADSFHISFLDDRLKLEEAIHNDTGYPIQLYRFFHNKVAFTINQVFVNYIHFWDIRFGVMLFSIIGYFGVFIGFWYLTKVKNKYKWVIFAVLLLIPLIEIFLLPISYQLRISILVIPYQVLSMFGYWQFIKMHRRRAVVFIVILILISIWYQAAFHNEIFFNCVRR